MNQNLKTKLKKIKLLAMDFDGVMTDGFVYVDENGRESVRCSRKDGLGIEMLKKNGLDAVVISKEANSVVTARCKKLKIQCWQRVKDGEGKLEILKKIIKEKNLSPENVAYIGDDLNDEVPLRFAGISFTVADGHPKIRAVVDYVTRVRGGEHAVREAAELILTAQDYDARF